MKLRQIIELEAKHSVGYSEAKDKESFMVGVGVAFSKASEHYERQIEQLKNQVKSHKSICDTYATDLKNLASIINRYLPDS